MLFLITLQKLVNYLPMEFSERTLVQSVPIVLSVCWHPWNLKETSRIGLRCCPFHRIGILDIQKLTASNECLQDTELSVTNWTNSDVNFVSTILLFFERCSFISAVGWANKLGNTHQGMVNIWIINLRSIFWRVITPWPQTW